MSQIASSFEFPNKMGGSDHELGTNIENTLVTVAKSQRNSESLLIDLARRQNLTIRQLYLSIAGARGHWQIVGTPEDCVEQIAELQRVTGTDHVVAEFSYGGIPHADAEKNMRLFANRVLPVLQQDKAFATPPAPAMEPNHPTAPGIFAPA